MNVSLHHQPNY